MTEQKNKPETTKDCKSQKKARMDKTMKLMDEALQQAEHQTGKTIENEKPSEFQEAFVLSLSLSESEREEIINRLTRKEKILLWLSLNKKSRLEELEKELETANIKEIKVESGC
jgi:hypothetical protein